jgi:DNA replication regulator SLD3
MRSASTTVIPGLKREGSEPLLMGIPRAESGLLKERPSNLFHRSLSLGGTEDWRAKKKAQVDAELKDAISALKKPNRSLAVKDFVEAADKRASAGQLKSMFLPIRFPSSK